MSKYNLSTAIDKDTGEILIKVFDYQVNRNWFVFMNDVHKLDDEALKEYITERQEEIKSGEYQVDGFKQEDIKNFPPLGFEPTKM